MSELASALDVVVYLAQEAPKTETREFLGGADAAGGTLHILNGNHGGAGNTQVLGLSQVGINVCDGNTTCP